MKRLLIIVALLCAVVQGVWAWSGSGTAESPFLIANGDDWNTFVTRTASSPCEGEYFALDGDITVTTMACGSRFKGTFDGKGHTMTLNIGTGNGESNVAPFRYADGATFKDLVLKGTVEGHGQYVASLLADAEGQTTIANCVSYATVKISANTTTLSNIGYNGGFVANNSGKGTLTITHCVYKGSLMMVVDEGWYVYLNNYINPVGGFIGLTQPDTYAVIDHCVLDYNEFTLNYGKVHGTCKTFSCGNNANITINDSYYVKTLGDAQGTPCYTTAPTEGLYGISASAYGNHTYYYNVVATVPPICIYTGEAIDPLTIRSAGGTLLTKNTDYSVSLIHDGSSATEVREKGNYQLTVTCKGSYVGSQTFHLKVMEDLSGEGTPESPYIIADVDDWDTFTGIVNTGFHIGNYYKLADDWSSKTGDGSNAATALTTTVGTEEHPFTGIFDGNGQTLRVNINNTSEMGTAPFPYISDATIKNVTVAGTITGTTHTSGLVGYAWAGTNTISNCTVSATVEAQTGNSRHMGGIVGHGKTSTVIIEDVIFNGSLIHSQDYAGGLQGWSDGNQLTIKNSFFLGSFSGGNEDNKFHPIALQDVNKTTTFTDQGAYYISTALPTIASSDKRIIAQGLKVTADSEIAPFSVTAPNGTTYYYNWLTTEINNEADWDLFLKSCYYSDTSFSGTYEGLTVNLNADIEVTTWMEPGSKKVFMGTFNGNDHTITVSYTTDNDNCAPFYMLNNATVKNLKVSGTINTAGQHAAGFAYCAVDNCTFDNCVSNVIIESNRSGAAYHGGFVAKAESTGEATLAFTRCAFTGKFNGNATHLGGFVGDATGQDADHQLTVSFRNCMFYPSGFGNPSDTDCYTFARLGNNANIDTNNAFYIDALGGKQGKMAWEIKNDESLQFHVLQKESSSVSHIITHDFIPLICYNSKLYAAAGDQISLTMDIPGVSTITDKVLTSINITDSQQQAVEAETYQVWYTNVALYPDQPEPNRIEFTMPASDVTVSAVFSDQPTGLYVNLLKYDFLGNSALKINIPSFVKTFKVYDNGGKNGKYDLDCDGSVTLIAPTGYVLKLSGTITTQASGSNEYLMVTDSDDTPLIDPISSISSGVERAIPTVFSSGQMMKIKFCSNSYEAYDGLDLTVTLVDTDEAHDITISNPDQGGIIEADMTQAKYGQVVSLTATPDEGYLLTDLLVTDDYGNSFLLSGGQLWYAPTPADAATFTMPVTAVTVTPVFTNAKTAEGGLFVKMPAKGGDTEPIGITTTIPAAVKSFKVYDDGGKDHNYSTTGITYIKFVAPENCQLQLKGTIETAKNDKIVVFDSDELYLPYTSSPNNGEPYEIPMVLSTDNSMQVLWNPESNKEYAGLDLTLTVVHADFETANAGTKEDPYLIEKKAHLDLLAHRVNGTGNETAKDYAGQFFRLQNDLAYTATSDWNNTESNENNFEAIGTSSHSFCGNFDGQGYTISGIRIYQPDVPMQGLFGNVVGGTVKNVVLANARITGNSYTGGIVGFNEHSTVNNCHVKSDVCINANNASWLGGIVGYNYGGRGASEVSNCTSRATISVKNGGDYFGAIAGENYKSKLSNNLAINAVVPAANNNKSGIIVSVSDENSTLENNYYTACTYGNSPNYTGKGCKDGDVTANDGAVPALRDDADNSTALSLLAANADVLSTYNIALDGRTLYKDGLWNTICLPFDFSLMNVDQTVLAGADVRKLESNGFETGTLTLTFSNDLIANTDEIGYDVLEAGKPYLIKWDSGDNLENPVFTNVTVKSAAEPTSQSEATQESGAAVENDYVRFIGSFSPVTLTADNRSVLYLGDNNKVYYPTAEVSIGSFRGYFQLNGIMAGDEVFGARSFVLDFGNGEATGIEEVKEVNEVGDNSWHTLDGRKLGGKPAVRGVYVHNNKKVIVMP